jgi:hypothetical protein
MATAAAPRVYKNFINGEWVDSRSGNAYENRNPANTDELIGMFVSSTAEDVDLAVDAANLAYKKWRLVPAPKRAEILFAAAELLIEHKEEFSKDMTREMGKVLAEASHRPDLLHGWGRAAPIRPNNAVRAARQICDERAAIHRHVRTDNSMEFSDGHSLVENYARPYQREYRGAEARGRHAALFV